MPGGSRRNADDALIAVLACGATNESAARSAGVSVPTVQRRLKDAKFRRRLQEAKDGIVQRMSDALRAAGPEGLRALLSLLAPTVSNAVQLGAARAVIELGMKAGEGELRERMAAVEEKLEGSP